MAESSDWIAHLVEELSVAIGVVDTAGRPLFVNRLARQVVGTEDESGEVVCPELLHHVREAHESGEEMQGVVLSCDLDGTQWRGSVRPLDANRVALVFQQEPFRDKPHLHLCAELGLEAPEARLALRIASGLSNPEIARRFGVSVSAIKSRVWMLCRKLDVRNRAAIAALVSRTLAESRPNGSGKRNGGSGGES